MKAENETKQNEVNRKQNKAPKAGPRK